MQWFESLSSDAISIAYRATLPMNDDGLLGEYTPRSLEIGWLVEAGVYASAAQQVR